MLWTTNLIFYHAVGGTLMSVLLLFGGLAFTVITLKLEDDNYGRKFK